MRRIIILSAILSISILLSLGCDNTSEVIIGPGGDSINTVINLEIFENIERGLTNLEIRCLPDSIFPCLNYQILFDLNITVDRVALTFTEMKEPAICLREI